jgi:hypothetical protein
VNYDMYGQKQTYCKADGASLSRLSCVEIMILFLVMVLGLNSELCLEIARQS